MIVLGEEGLAVLAAASAEGQVARGNENQIALQNAVTDFATAIDGRREAMIGTEGGQRGRASKELGCRGGYKEFFGVPPIDALTRFCLDNEDSPARLLIFRAIDDLVDLRRERLFSKCG